MEDLLKGIAVVIDNKIEDDPAIENIFKQMIKRNMPWLEYKNLPENAVIDHFTGISFIILDWKLIDNIQAVEGVILPENLIQYNNERNIDFLNYILSTCFVPIFIFTNEDVNDVISILRDNDLYDENGCTRIFVKKKSDIAGIKNTCRNRLFSTIEDWLKKNPSVYVIKEWEREYQEAKDQLFIDFLRISPYWPYILWKTFSDDGANKSLELGEILTRNIYTRMSPITFNDDILKKRYKSVEEKTLRNVIEGAHFIKREHLDETDIATGDIFKEEYIVNDITKTRYFLNIRAQCDLIRSSNPELYCLKGKVLKEETINIKDGIRFHNGQFIEKINHAIVGFIDNGKFIEFKFHDLKIKKWNNIREIRIGRLLSPNINRIQQKYSLYMQRQGLPRLPDLVIQADE